ncbi:MAG: class I SAM-dependent methyltransferase [Anaerolineae bacterium]
MQADGLTELVAAVLNGKKYRHMAPDLVRRIGARELDTRRNLKEAIKATRNKLHQVGAAYQPERARYSEWLEELRRAAGRTETELRAACAGIMAQHASTRERLAILDTLYETVLCDLAPVRSVMDIACGFNPLAIPWMQPWLESDALYHAYDIYTDLAGFLNEAIPLLGARPKAEARDVLSPLPDGHVDVAYLLKAVPCLEQMDKDAGPRLLKSLPARHVVVSFPVHSLGGRNKGMAANYEARFRELVGGGEWDVRRYQFETELVFVVSR